MATYCYVTNDGERTERQYPLGKAPRSVRIRGRRARRDHRAEQGHIDGGKGNWPLHCTTGGVHANEVPRHRKNCAQAGLKVDVNNDGSVTIPNQNEYRRYCRKFGLRHFSDYMT